MDNRKNKLSQMLISLNDRGKLMVGLTPEVLEDDEELKKYMVLTEDHFNKTLHTSCAFVIDLIIKYFTYKKE